MAKKRRQNAKTAAGRGSRNKPSSGVRFFRFLALLVVLALLGGLCFGAYRGVRKLHDLLFRDNPAFEIYHLEITGDGRLSEDRIREYSGLREGLNLFAVDLKEVEKKLSEVPDIESVYIERRLPHTLVVKVRERVPVARIRGSESLRYPFLVDRNGVVMAYRLRAAGLPLITGVAERLRPGRAVQDPDVAVALRILNLCDAIGYLRRYVRIERIDLSYDDFIDVRLEGGTRVRMPRHDLQDRLENLAAILKLARDQGRRLKEIDLTLDSPKAPVVPY